MFLLILFTIIVNIFLGVNLDWNVNDVLIKSNIWFIFKINIFTLSILFVGNILIKTSK